MIRWVLVLAIGCSEPAPDAAIDSGAPRVDVAPETELTPATAAPSFDPPPGDIISHCDRYLDIRITSATPAAVVHYTVDGSMPGVTSPTAKGPVRLTLATGSVGVVVKAIAIAPELAASAVVAGEYHSDSWLPSEVTAQPIFDPAPGAFVTEVAVSMKLNTAGSVAYFTLDGSTPTTSSAMYTGPIRLTATTTLRAIAKSPGFQLSCVTMGTYEAKP
jgi:hypothetical protein